MVCCHFFKKGLPDSAVVEDKSCYIERTTSWAVAANTNSDSFGGTEHFDGVCEQMAAACLMVTWTGCVPENGAVGMAVGHCLGANWWRGAQHIVASDHLGRWS